MKHFNKNKLLGSWSIPFLSNTEVLITGCVNYTYRGTHGTQKDYKCDFLEVRDMLTNKVFFEDLYWFEIEFLVFDVIKETQTFRTWRFLESHDEAHFWLDVDKQKWYFAD